MCVCVCVCVLLVGVFEELTKRMHGKENLKNSLALVSNSQSYLVNIPSLNWKVQLLNLMYTGPSFIVIVEE